MKKTISLFLMILMLLTLCLPLQALAQEAAAPPEATGETAQMEDPSQAEAGSEAAEGNEETEVTLPPVLTAISFSNAELDGTFSSDVFEYQLTITNTQENVRLASYKCPDYTAQVQVYYLSNTSGDASGLVVRLTNDGGTNEYKFLFDTIKEIKKTPDASLMNLSFDYGELSPAFDADIYKYTLYLPKDLEVLQIRATPSDENAKINTPSQITLGKEQNSPIAVKVTSSDGTNTITYKLNIKRVDKTIAQIKAEMEDPNYISFVEIPFYKTAPFYIITGVILFLIALALVLFFTLRKKRAAQQAALQADNTESSATVRTMEADPIKTDAATTPDTATEAESAPIPASAAPAARPEQVKEIAAPQTDRKAVAAEPVDENQTQPEPPAVQSNAAAAPEPAAPQEDMPAESAPNSPTEQPKKKVRWPLFSGKQKKQPEPAAQTAEAPAAAPAKPAAAQPEQKPEPAQKEIAPEPPIHTEKPQQQETSGHVSASQQRKEVAPTAPEIAAPQEDMPAEPTPNPSTEQPKKKRKRPLFGGKQKKQPGPEAQTAEAATAAPAKPAAAQPEQDPPQEKEKSVTDWLDLEKYQKYR